MVLFLYFKTKKRDNNRGVSWGQEGQENCHMEMTRLLQNNNHSYQNFLYQLENVCIDYGKNRALSYINLVINKSEILFITGASGAGKTSLLKLLSNIIKPSKGKIISVLDNVNLFSAHVFQDLKLIEELSVEDNLWFSFDKKVFKKKADFIRERDDLLKILGLEEKLKAKIKNLNRGAKQKIAILRSLLTRPEVFIADEPTSALDKENAQKVFELLNYMNTKRKMTIIWATHNKELVKQFSGKIIHLEKGKLVYTGNTCFI